MLGITFYKNIFGKSYNPCIAKISTNPLSMSSVLKGSTGMQVKMKDLLAIWGCLSTRATGIRPSLSMLLLKWQPGATIVIGTRTAPKPNGSGLIQDLGCQLNFWWLQGHYSTIRSIPDYHSLAEESGVNPHHTINISVLRMGRKHQSTHKE